MKAFLTVVLGSFFWLIFGVSGAQAKIIFDWSHAQSVSLDVRQETERCLKKAAGEYLSPKYANLGPYDFINSSDEFTVMVMNGYERDSGAKAEYFPGVRGGTIFADPSFLNNPNLLQIGFFHELCHAYDYIMTDTMRRNIRFFLKVRKLVGINSRDVRGWYSQYLLNNEKRAFIKEEQYINDTRSQLSDGEHDEAMRHVIDGKRNHGLAN